MQRSNKLFSYIGFSIKSGKVAFGYEKVIATGDKIRLILLDGSIGRSAKNEITFFAKNLKIPVAFLPENELSYYTGGKTVKCIGLKDEGLALAAKNELNKLSEVVIDE